MNALEEANAADDINATIPAIGMDIWFQVSEADLYLVIPLLPSTAWIGSLVGIRVEFAARSPAELLQRYRQKKETALAQAEALPDGGGNYVPWPKSLTDYLDKELQTEFELRYSVLDHAQFNDDLEADAGYQPAACVFRGDPASDSESIRPPIPILSGH